MHPAARGQMSRDPFRLGRQPDAEVELSVAHHPGVGVREGQVANVGLVHLRESDVAGVDALDGLPQLQVEGDHADPVDPGGEPVPWEDLLLQGPFQRFQILHCFNFIDRLMHSTSY